ncbi:DUF602 domain-containing protein [Cordyceps fumosorosea ARSEF 2679]|uniref:DUF602 domain-containing protein n=1 Tax=Cordyceps fumosorosea (strain ARSEF 2679) TaxID=1081104 RepID=A0A167LEB7_CORFA|nr:DUF602 domain-containing protein [Cordyceps fumosorosea ARSEF 2679]OAA52984.1 DUF602 domain-containing protein [Cordyceps fumosorosea ARSEF 2679]
MGNDGGSIPKRRELVKNAARMPTVSELKATILESLGHAWSHCTLSDAPLDMETAVSDASGRLYNYEAVLKYLMPDEESTDSDVPLTNIRSLRDIVRLKFLHRGGKWICPVSLKEMGPATRSVYIVPCGHAFAEVAVTEIKEDLCPECSEPFERKNVITILPTTDKDIERLVERMEELRSKGLSHSLKKDKSEKKKKRKGETLVQANGDKTDEKAATNNKKAKREYDRTGDINNPIAASLTARVMAEQDEKNRQRRLAQTAATGR